MPIRVCRSLEGGIWKLPTSKLPTCKRATVRISDTPEGHGSHTGSFLKSGAPT